MKKTKKGTIVTNITIPEETYIKVVRMAEKEQRSFSNMVSIILSKEVEK